MTLTDLRDKVAAGRLNDGIDGQHRHRDMLDFVYGGGNDAFRPHYECLVGAFDGSLDAAKALHEALLPGWEITLWQESEYRHERKDGKWRCRLEWLHGKAHGSGKWGHEVEGQNDNPARAWLLAILDALIREERG